MINVLKSIFHLQSDNRRSRVLGNLLLLISGAVTFWQVRWWPKKWA